MSLENFRALKEKRDELVLVATDMAVIGAPYGTKLPDKIVDEQGNLLPLPEGWMSFGEVSKEAGAELAPERKFNDILGYGSMAPRRRIKESEGLTLNITPQETRKMLLAMQYSVQMADLKQGEGNSGFRARKFANGGDEYWSILLIGFDGTKDKPIFPWWLFDKMSIGEGGKQSLKMDSPIAPELQFTAYESTDGGMYDFGIGGKGWVDLSVAAGFDAANGVAKAPLSLTITGAEGGTFTLSYGGETTGALNYNAVAATIQKKLEELSSVGAGNVQVSGSNGDFTIVFTSNAQSSTLTVDGAALTGDGASAKVADGSTVSR